MKGVLFFLNNARTLKHTSKVFYFPACCGSIFLKSVHLMYSSTKHVLWKRTTDVRDGPLEKLWRGREGGGVGKFSRRINFFGQHFPCKNFFSQGHEYFLGTKKGSLGVDEFFPFNFLLHENFLHFESSPPPPNNPHKLSNGLSFSSLVYDA